MVGVRPRPESSRSWLREHRVLIPRYIAEATASLTSSQLALYGVGAVAGLETLGELRVGQLLIGPVLVIFIGMQLVAVPMAVRSLAVSTAHLRRLCLVVGLAMAGIAIAWGGVLTLMPADLGRVLLGPNWDPAHRLALILALGLAASSFSSGALIGLRAFAAATRSLRATVISSLLATVLTVWGAWLGGALGAAWGILLAHAAVMPLWWWEFRQEAARYVAPAADAGAKLNPATNGRLSA
jgi:O-antigen/teichoic acid export membrane protein